VDDNMIRMDWFISNLLGGIKLKVRAEDAEAASDMASGISSSRSVPIAGRSMSLAKN
jgi:hypothetical protein